MSILLVTVRMRQLEEVMKAAMPFALAYWALEERRRREDARNGTPFVELAGESVIWTVVGTGKQVTAADCKRLLAAIQSAS